MKDIKGKVTIVEKAYKDFYDKYGYIPKFFNPYNCSEITDFSPTITSACGSTTTSGCVLILEIEEGEDGYSN